MKDFQVLVPYSQLAALLTLPDTVKRVETENQELCRQLDALRSQYVELLEKVREIDRYL